MTGLAGMFFMADQGDTYSTGRIVALVATDCWMCQFDNMRDDDGIGRPMEIVHISDMIATGREGMKNWCFFETRAEIDAWLAWLESPSKPNVVRLVKREGAPE